jgi:hypothetical protein
VTCGAQNGLHHVVRQQFIERRPVAAAFVLSMLMGVGASQSVEFDIAFGITVDHLTLSWNSIRN